MKKITTILAAVFLCAMLAAGTVAADSLTGVDIKWDNGGASTGYNGWYSNYYFKADGLGDGYNIVFCVENADVNAQFDYELIDYAGRNLDTAAKMADAFYTKSLFTNATQRDFQIAIWNALGIAGAGLTNLQKTILNYGWANYTLQGDIALLNSPPGSATGSAQSQDFLINRKVAVPEPTMALILGGLLTGIGVLGRRQFLK